MLVRAAKLRGARPHEGAVRRMAKLPYGISLDVKQLANEAPRRSAGGVPAGHRPILEIGEVYAEGAGYGREFHLRVFRSLAHLPQ